MARYYAGVPYSVYAARSATKSLARIMAQRIANVAPDSQNQRRYSDKANASSHRPFSPCYLVSSALLTKQGGMNALCTFRVHGP